MKGISGNNIAYRRDSSPGAFSILAKTSYSGSAASILHARHFLVSYLSPSLGSTDEGETRL